jgi:hypothetical protein
MSAVLARPVFIARRRVMANAKLGQSPDQVRADKSRSAENGNHGLHKIKLRIVESRIL